MAKRKRRGANSRKNYVQRRKKTISRIRNVFPVAAVIVLLIIAGVYLFASGIVSVGKVIAAVENSDFFNVKKIVVKGTRQYDKAEIVSMTGLENVTKMYKVKEKEVNATLDAVPWIEKARCVKKWWGSIVIEITERKPVAFVHSGEILLVDRTGLILPVEPGCEYNLPLVYGISIEKKSSGRSYVDSTTMKRLNDFVESLRTVDEQWMETISQVDMGDSTRVQCHLKGSAFSVALPYNVDEKKLRNLQYLMDVMEREKGGECIDLRYNNIAFVSMEKENE